MNKAQLVEQIADKAEVPKKQADTVLTAAIAAIIEAVAEGNKVTLIGFGSFERRDRKERKGRNPKTGDEIVIPAAKVPSFSPGKMFRERMIDS